MDYAELQTDIADWLDRTDLSAKIPQFIQLAECKVNRILRVADQASSSQIIGTGASSYPLDSTVRGFRSVSYNGKPLGYLTPQKMTIAVANTLPELYFYTLEGNTLILNNVLNVGSVLDLLGYQQVPELSDTVTTNWLLDKHPDVYLYGSMAEACRYIKDYTQEQANRGLMASAMQDVHTEDARDRWSGDTMRILAG